MPSLRLNLHPWKWNPWAGPSELADSLPRTRHGRGTVHERGWGGCESLQRMSGGRHRARCRLLSHLLEVDRAQELLDV